MPMSESASIQWAASILDVEPNAEAETVERAFRQKAKECHPDVNADSDAEVQFQRVMQARLILTEGPEQANPELTGHGFGQPTTDGESKQTDHSGTDTDGTAGSGGSTGTDRYATHDTNPDDESPFAAGVSDSDIWEEWEAEREHNERTGHSRYTQSGRQRHWEQTRAEDQSQPTANSSDSSARGRRNTNGRSRGSQNTVAHGHGWGQGIQTAVRYFACLALLFGIFVALIPLGIGGGSPLVSLTSQLGFVLVVGGLSGGIAAHQTLSTAIRARQHRPSSDFGDVPLRVIAGSNITGIGLAAIAYSNGYELAGFRFVADMFVPALVFVILGALFGIITSLVVHSSSDLSDGAALNRPAILSGVVGGLVGLFGILTRINTIPFFGQAGSGVFTASPWVPTFAIASIKLSIPLNFLVGVVMIATLLGSFTVAFWTISGVRDSNGYSRDRSDYRTLKHGIRTLLIAIPPAVLLWLHLSGQRTLELSLGMLSRPLLTGIVLLYPTLLTGGLFLFVSRR